MRGRGVKRAVQAACSLHGSPVTPQGPHLPRLTPSAVTSAVTLRDQHLATFSPALAATTSDHHLGSHSPPSAVTPRHQRLGPQSAPSAFTPRDQHWGPHSPPSAFTPREQQWAPLAPSAVTSRDQQWAHYAALSDFPNSRNFSNSRSLSGASFPTLTSSRIEAGASRIESRKPAPGTVCRIHTGQGGASVSGDVAVPAELAGPSASLDWNTLEGTQGPPEGSAIRGLRAEGSQFPGMDFWVFRQDVDAPILGYLQQPKAATVALVHGPRGGGKKTAVRVALDYLRRTSPATALATVNLHPVPLHPSELVPAWKLRAKGEAGVACTEFRAELERGLEALAAAGCLRHAVSAHRVFTLLTRRLSVGEALGRVRDSLKALSTGEESLSKSLAEQGTPQCLNQGHFDSGSEARASGLHALGDHSGILEGRSGGRSGERRSTGEVKEQSEGGSSRGEGRRFLDSREVRKEWVLALQDIIRLWEPLASTTTAGTTAGTAMPAGRAALDLTLGPDSAEWESALSAAIASPRRQHRNATDSTAGHNNGSSVKSRDIPLTPDTAQGQGLLYIPSRCPLHALASLALARSVLAVHQRWRARGPGGPSTPGVSRGALGGVEVGDQGCTRGEVGREDCTAAQVEGAVAWSGFLVELLSGAITEGVFEPKLVIADVDELRRSPPGPPAPTLTSALTSAVTSAGAAPPVPGADFHDALLMQVTGIASRGAPMLPVVLTSSDSYYSKDVFTHTGAVAEFSPLEVFACKSTDALPLLTPSYFTPEQADVVEGVLSCNPRHLAEFCALWGTFVRQNSDRGEMEALEDALDLYLEGLHVCTVAPAMEEALAHIENFGAAAAQGQLPEWRTRFGMPWAYPPRTGWEEGGSVQAGSGTAGGPWVVGPSPMGEGGVVGDSRGEGRVEKGGLRSWARVQMLDFLYALVQAEFAMSYGSDSGTELLEDPAAAALVKVGLMYLQRDPPFLRPTSVAFQRCLVRWLVIEEMSASPFSSMKLLWLRTVRGRYYRHLLGP